MASAVTYKLSKLIDSEFVELESVNLHYRSEDKAEATTEATCILMRKIEQIVLLFTTGAQTHLFMHYPLPKQGYGNSGAA